MNEEELKEILKELREQGWNPLLCDTPVPFYDTAVRCGQPMEVYTERPDNIMLPKDLLSMQPEFTIWAKGDSMKDAGICQGDMVKVVCVDTPQDGDIVLATIDGESTIKTYCEDEEGFPWLVPQNSDYTPIPLKDKVNVRIVGRIKEIIKNAPRISYRDCQRMIRKAKMTMVETHEIPQQRVSWAIREVASMVTIARQWYAVYRAMVDLNVVKDGDYETFCEMVKTEAPQHQRLPNSGELQRLAMLSFTKPVRYWNAENAPVKGKRFNDYLMIANRTTELLKGD